jgi:hypothetical protein
MKAAYKVQIDMSEFGEAPIWQDVEGVEFVSKEAAEAHIQWMKKEYGDTIEYRTRTAFYASPRTVPAYYEADGGSMWNGVGRSYF